MGAGLTTESTGSTEKNLEKTANHRDTEKPKRKAKNLILTFSVSLWLAVLP
jgi:hypothetical protein